MMRDHLKLVQTVKSSSSTVWAPSLMSLFAARNQDGSTMAGWRMKIIGVTIWRSSSGRIVGFMSLDTIVSWLRIAEVMMSCFMMKAEYSLTKRVLP